MNVFNIRIHKNGQIKFFCGLRCFKNQCYLHILTFHDGEELKTFSCRKREISKTLYQI